MSTTSITLEFDSARLEDPVVADAVAAVMLALEGYDPQARATAPAKVGKAARKPAEAPATQDTSKTAEEAYRAFVVQLPEPSQRFLALLEKVGTLTISDAVVELGLSKPKSLGGITGAIARWAPTRGSVVPFEKLTIAGERAWRWLGVNG